MQAKLRIAPHALQMQEHALRMKETWPTVPHARSTS
jgi:hypothetical protein